MTDPFLIDSPSVISFSGGRTSAYMLWRVLQSNGGLPPEARVVYVYAGDTPVEAYRKFVAEDFQRMLSSRRNG